VITYDRPGYAPSGGGPVRLASAHTADAAAILEYLRTSLARFAGRGGGQDRIASYPT
jgi:hypothetical protein